MEPSIQSLEARAAELERRLEETNARLALLGGMVSKLHEHQSESEIELRVHKMAVESILEAVAGKADSEHHLVFQTYHKLVEVYRGRFLEIIENGDPAFAAAIDSRSPEDVLKEMQGSPPDDRHR